MSNHDYAHAGTGPGIGFSDTATTLLRHFFEGLGAAHERYQQRRALLALDDAHLDDIGVTRAEALAEARKPVWR